MIEFRKLKLVIAFVIFAMAIPAMGQDDLMNLIDEPEKKEYATATFKGSRLILGHSVETKGKNELEFLISHRFGRINSGAHELYGLDAAFIRLGLEYGISDNINVGIGRSSYDKILDSFLKFRVLRQSEGGFPFTVTLFNSVTMKMTPKKEDDPSYDTKDRLAYTSQLLLARKFSNNFSLQVMPVYVHRNRVETFDENGQFALGVGGRLKLTKRLTFNAEYYYRVDAPEDSPYKDAISVGFDIETGGHVFQLHFTNSQMTIERSFITETSDDFFDGDIHFGFNISRTFSVGGKKKEDW